MLYGERGDFCVGDWPYHMYVEYQQPGPGVLPHRLPVVMYHGGMGTGSAYWSTPDGRKSWAPYFVEHGWTVYVVDWPGHGRSGFPRDFATMPYERVVAAGVALAEKLGPSILLTGSMSGPVGWKIAEESPQNVAAIISWGPGPPANLQEVNAKRPDQSEPSWADETQPVRYKAASADKTFDREEFHRRFAGGPRYPNEAFEQAFMKEAPESARIVNQRYNKDGSGLHVDSSQITARVLVITDDNSPGHPREADESVARFFGGDHIWLPDVGLRGFSHQMRFDHGNLDIADLMFVWLAEKGIR